MARLTDAAVEELGTIGYHALTVRGVARRAEVAAATAYTYFGSKEHLVAEVFWRRYEAQDPAIDPAAPPAVRALAVLDGFAMVADEPELAAACTVALLADDAEVRDLRARIGRELHRRLGEALGPDADPRAVRTLELSTSGALLQAGTGHLPYDAIPEVLADVADLVIGDHP